MVAGHPKILALCGSSRAGSFNAKLLAIAVAGAREAGAEVTVLDLRSLEIAIYDGDAEAANGLPEGAKVLRAAIAGHGGILIASPEYNGFMTPLLLNALAWASRPATSGEAPAAVFHGKVAAMVSASPAAGAGLRGVGQLASLLHNLQVTVLPGPVGVAFAHQAFTADGQLLDGKLAARVRAVGASLTQRLA